MPGEVSDVTKGKSSNQKDGTTFFTLSRPKSQKDPDRFKVDQRWTPALIADGFTPVADVFLRNYHKFSVSSSEAILIIQIMSFKWDAKLPYPSAATLAERMGITETAVRNNVRSLEQKQLLKRLPQKGKTNLFDLRPLFEKLTEYTQQDAFASSTSDGK